MELRLFGFYYSMYTHKLYVCMGVYVCACVYMCARLCLCMYVRMYVPVLKFMFNKK